MLSFLEKMKRFLFLFIQLITSPQIKLICTSCNQEYYFQIITPIVEHDLISSFPQYSSNFYNISFKLSGDFVKLVHLEVFKSYCDF